MEKNNVLTNFSNKSDGDLFNITSRMHDALKDNSFFTFADGKMVRFLTLINTFSEAQIKAANGGRTEVLAKNTVREELQNEASDIAKIVNQQAKGDVTALTSSGGTLWKENDSHPEFPAPENIKLSSGITHGVITVEVPVKKNTRMYCIYHTPMPASADMKQWTSLLSTKHKATVTGLTPGLQHAVRAGYVGTNGNINLSETFTIFVQ
jgi:hypothetical protein